jgi:hypothetical protein
MAVSMQLYNFDFMKNEHLTPMETVYRVAHDLEQAKNYCINLFRTRGAAIGADWIQVRVNGGTKVLYSWPEH